MDVYQIATPYGPLLVCIDPASVEAPTDDVDTRDDDAPVLVGQYL